MNTEQLSMLEVATELLNQKKTPQVIFTLIQEVLELKEKKSFVYREEVKYRKC